jgi:hypothetical protein
MPEVRTASPASTICAVAASPASRLRPALRWLAPSAVAACAGAVIAGLVEGHAAGAVGAVTAAGFVAVLAVPALLAGGAIVRGVVAAWRPGELAAALIDADGAAPRLAGWIAVIWLGSLGLAAAMFESVWALSVYTAFKPLTLSFVEPAIAIATVLALVAVSRPSARLFAWIAHRIDARWRRRGRRTLLRPSIIAATAAITAIAVIYLLWRATTRYRVEGFDGAVLHAPIAGVAAAAGLHAAWRRLPRARRALGAATARATAVVLAIAIAAALARPALALEVRRDRPLAGLAIEWLFDVDALRSRSAP